MIQSSSLPFPLDTFTGKRPQKRFDVVHVAIAVALALVVVCLFLPPTGVGGTSSGDEIFIGP